MTRSFVFFCVTQAALSSLAGPASCQIEIIRLWNGTASEGEKAVVAVRTSADIEGCQWVNLDADDSKVYR